MNGFHLLAVVALVLAAVVLWDEWWRGATTSDSVEVVGITLHRAEVHRVDRLVRPGGQRDLIVFTNAGATSFVVSGQDAATFWEWWSPD
jgi:hypothetical protein